MDSAAGREYADAWRYIEAAAAGAGDRAFGLILACDGDAEELLDAVRGGRDTSLGHLSPARRDQLGRHLIGSVNWAQVVTALDLPTRLLR